MAFLERQVRFGHWLRVSGPLGDEYVDAQHVGEIEEFSGKLLVPIPPTLHNRCRNKLAWSIRKVEGWGARIAPFGLLDQTAWDVFPSQIEAERFLDSVAYLYGDNDIQVFGQGEDNRLLDASLSTNHIVPHRTRQTSFNNTLRRTS